MTWFGSDVGFKDTRSLDAFGRLRVSNPTTLFAMGQEYTYAPLWFENYVAGTATATYGQAGSKTTLSTVDASSGNRAMRQTKLYWRYQYGKSQLAKLTGILAESGTPSGAAFAGIGYYDDNNGVFFCRDATGYCVVVRSNVTGSVVDNSEYQANWNLDKMNGTGPSGLTVDFTQEQIFIIDLQWLGVGRVRFGLQINGLLYYVHEFVHANVTTDVYMKTANLPLRYEVFNSGGAGSLITMSCVCCAVESEGGAQDEGGYWFSCGTKGLPSGTLANSATLVPILTIRLRDTFAGLTYRGHVHFLNMDLLTKSSDIYYEWLWNVSALTSGGGAVNELTAGTWTNVDTTYSGVEYNTAATAVSGGVVIAAGYGLSGAGSQAELSRVGVQQGLMLARTYANTRDTMTLAARGIGGNATAYATVNFQEQY